VTTQTLKRVEFEVALKLSKTCFRWVPRVDAHHRSLLDVPPKSRFPRKAERQVAPEEIVIRWNAFVLEHGELPLNSIYLSNDSQTPVRDDWEAEEEAEMEE